MTDETLKYYIALQEKIRGMGPILPGDWVANNTGLVGFVLAVGQPHEVFVRFSENCQRCCDPEELIRLPLPIDPVNPKRGLLGMLKGFKTLANPLGKWVIAGDLGNPENFYADESDTPTEALLRALIAQEGL